MGNDKCVFCEKPIEIGEKTIAFVIYERGTFEEAENYFAHYDCYVKLLEDTAEILEKIEEGDDE